MKGTDLGLAKPDDPIYSSGIMVHSFSPSRITKRISLGEKDTGNANEQQNSASAPTEDAIKSPQSVE